MTMSTMSKRQAVAVSSGVAGVAVAAMLIVVRAQTPDPRVQQLHTLATQVAAVRDSTPALPAAAAQLLTQAVDAITQASALVPDVPPPTTTPGSCGESTSEWHAPVVNGCATGHEHGDAPPDWVHASSWHPMFLHPGNTPNENVLKHTSFKGFSMRLNNVDLYTINHLDTHPNGQQTRFHSYQVWARDPTGAVSHWDLWADFGTNDAATPTIRAVDTCGTPQTIRPIIQLNFPECPAAFENWYPRSGTPLWGWDFGFNTKAQYYAGPKQGTLSSGDLANISTWLPTGQLNNERRIELAWYSNRSPQRGTFYSTQWGDIVSGPSDARCGTQRTIGGRAYETLCIEQYIAPSMLTVQFPGNSIQKTYPSTGVRLPN
jgi:hypothetical protein